MNYLKIKNTILYPCIVCGACSFSQAEEKWLEYEHLYLQGGTYFHLRNNDDYDGPNLMVGMEAIKSNDRVYGIFLFDNSFGQFSQYLYAGKKWDFSENFENLHARLTAGVIHGYKEPWDDKLPFTTRNGWSPGIIPSIGYQKGKVGFDVMLLGYEGILLTVGTNF